MHSPINLLLFVLSVSATGILLPLYVYPGPDAANWAVVSKAVAAYPDIRWQIIINPHSGPGTNASSPYPNIDYIAGIKALNGYTNVQTLGYVDTAYGRRSVQEVNSDVDKYNAWLNYSRGDISMDGIFFDDVPSIYDFKNSPNTEKSNETYFKTITSYASTTLPSADTPVVCNPGNPSDSNFFEYCSTMVEFESSYTTYNSRTIGSISNNGGIMNQTAIIMYETPTDLTPSALQTMIGTMKANKVAWVDLTNDCCYNVLNGTLLTMIAAACNNETNIVAKAAATSIHMPGTGWLQVISLAALLSLFV